MTEQQKEDQKKPEETAESLAKADCSRPGELLRAAREAKGLSQEEVAKKLNFLPLYVPALEDEKFEPLHSITFIKGYLRAYARFLEIDADEVLRCFVVHHPELVKQETPQSVEALKSEKNTSSMIFKLFSLLVVIALVAVIIIWWQSRSAESLPSVSNQDVQVDTLDGDTIVAPVQIEAITSIQPVAIEEKKTEQSLAIEQQPEVAVVAPVLEKPALEKPTVVKPVVAASVVKEKPLVAATVVEEKPVVNAAAKAPVKTINGDPATVTAGNNNLVALVFSNECWVEVRDDLGRMLHASLMQADDQILLEGKPPFQVVFGNGTVAKVFYEGKNFDFSSRIRSNGYASIRVE
ncbi:MAG TPA: RodZ family helix-turn-helix domain-containing protein [Marinospirillum sp.]|uniref:RodZ family helix-turn-helix domain-containing protein n=1 Tax=Marinospirillum sp. TaxID=2183934 RepID=UPI002B464368|nr:RodZ family helix-turn-helix domain-containing protein [Marinospirillum sp.]HKM16263.1 RodZ family helix-turn-helix domain-containing protein [Marinospirillum sp.]